MEVPDLKLASNAPFGLTSFALSLLLVSPPARARTRSCPAPAPAHSNGESARAGACRPHCLHN